MQRRWAWFLAGLGASLLVTVALWGLGIPGFFLFLAVPFLFLPLGGGAPAEAAAACPSCGARRQAAHSFCPACGAALR